MRVAFALASTAIFTLEHLTENFNRAPEWRTNGEHSPARALPRYFPIPEINFIAQSPILLWATPNSFIRESSFSRTFRSSTFDYPNADFSVSEDL